MKLKKGFAIAQAALLMLTLVTMAFPVSAFADPSEDPGNSEPEVQSQTFTHQDDNDDDDQDNDGEDHENDGHNGTLVVHKVIVGNPDASPSSFSFTVKKHHSQNTISSSAFNVSGQNSMTVHAGHYDVTETPADHYTTSYDNCSNVNVHKNQTTTCTITNTYVPPAPDTATVYATKIVCDNESDLPNAMGASHTTDANTATNFLANHRSCHLQSGWKFEWGNQDAGDAGNAFIGHASGYTESGATGVDGTVAMTVPLTGVNSIHVREQLQDGYIPFTYDAGSTTPNGNNVSAEISCSNDGLNYDNLDFINSPAPGGKYYCVAWNVAKPAAPTCNPEINLVQNGGFETPDVATGSYDIIPQSNPLLKWFVVWTSPQDSGRLGLEIQDHVAGDPAEGAQHAELDGDHPVTISQQLATVPGQTYVVNFKYSPRAGRNAADNTIKVKAGGSALGADLAVDGSANSNTVWLPYTRTFVATGASTLLEFADTGTDTSFGGYLDDVSVSCVPDQTSCPAGQHFNSDHICVPDVQECNADATQTLLSGDQGEGELITAALTHGAAKLVASPNGAWFAPALGDGLWIWKETSTSDADAQNPTSQTFERKFKILGAPIDATLTIAADNTYDVKVNGHQECSNLTEFNYGATVNCTIPAGDQITGWNTLDITVTNKPIENSTGANNPAGLSYKLVTHDNQCSPENATIVIVKNTAGGDGSFDFDVTGNDSNTDADVSTTEGGGSTTVSVPAGNYNVTETVLSGWNLDSVSCVYNNKSIGNAIANGEAVSLDAGDTVTCTFHNTKTTDNTPTTTNGTTGSGGGKKHSNGGGEVLGASTCSPLLTDYLKFGWKNNTDQVSKLQQFLNEHLGLTLPTTGFFGQTTFNAVKQFQKQYGNDVLHPWIGLPGSGISGDNTPTGFVYQTTRWKINNIFCPGSEAFPTVLN